MVARFRALFTAFVLVATAVFAPIAAIVPPVSATTINVNIATDPAPCKQNEVTQHLRSCTTVGNFPQDGRCSLRAAVQAAINNSNASDPGECNTGTSGAQQIDVVQIAPALAGSTLTLDATQGPMSFYNDANNKIEIIGPTTNAAQFVISGGNAIRIFEFGFVNVASAFVQLANLTISNGAGHTINGDPLKTQPDNDGGAILAFYNTNLTLDNVTMSNNNAAGRGGAIFVQGPATITNNGGGYVNNHAAGNGGAIFAFEGPMTYNGYAMLLSGNTSGGKGGALAYNADTNTNFTHIERSLMVNNSATNGGGVYFAQPTINGSIHTTFELTDSTITGPGGVFLSLDSNERFRYLRNTFQNAGSIYFAGGGFMANNIVIGSTCSGNQNAGNYTGLRNLWSSVPAGCQGPGNIGAPTNVSNTLAQNGGPDVQQTYKLTSGSNAIDNGSQAWCGTIDARSVPRGVDGNGVLNNPQPGDCDIGAYEFARYIVNFTTGTSSIAEGGGTAQIPVKLSIPDPADRPLPSSVNVAIARDPSSTARATVDYQIPPAGVTFPAGSTDGTIVNLPITIIQDKIDEFNGEFVILKLVGGNGVIVAEPATHNLSISDDDLAGVTKSDGGNGTTVSEATPGTKDSFTVALATQPDYAQDPNDSSFVGAPADVTVHAEPDRDCTIKVAGVAGTGSLGNPLSWTILNANWQTGTAVDVFAVDDPWDEDLRDESVTHFCNIKYTFSSTDLVYNGITDQYSVNVGDDDVAGVTITQSGGSTDLVEDGATDTYTIVLNLQPDPGKPLPNPARTPTVVRATPNGACSVGAGNGVAKDFSFDGNTWNQPQTVTVTANDNLTVELGHTCVITHTVLGGDPIYNNLSAVPSLVAGITANIQDYDPPGVTNDPPFADIAASGPILVDEAAPTTADTFTVVLERQPLNQNVQIVLTPSTDPRIPGDQLLLQNAAAGSPAAAGTLTVTFTPANWNVAQTVKVFAVNDDYDETSPHAHHITATFTSTAVGFNDPTLRKFVLDGTATLNTGDIPVDITDNDTSSVDVTETGGSTNIAEGGATDTFSVKLGTHPYNDVTVTVTPDSQCDLGNGAGVAKVLTFPDATWNTPQVVTVTAFDDDVIELASQTCTITNVATSADVLYNNLAGENVVAHITDNDPPQILIATGGGVAVAEATPTTGDAYTVALKGKPDANVTVNVTVGDGQTVVSSDGTTFGATASLTFTPANYATTQTVTVRAVDDVVDEADTHTGVIGHALTTTATGYATAPEFLVDGVAGSNVQVSVADNDTAGVTVSAGDASVDVTEGGASDTFNVVLTSMPLADVTVTGSSNGQCTIGPAVTFTPAEWNIAKTVSVSAVDDVTVEGAHTCPINAVVTSGDPKYGGVAVSSITANITDNDTASVLITSTGVALSEATPATTTPYTVVLGAQPIADVVVHATVSDGQTQLSAGGATTKDLTFTNANWDQPQTVTVWVVDDNVQETSPHIGVIVHTVTSTAIGFDSNPLIKVDSATTNEVHIPITDNDSPDIALTKSDGGASVAPGGVVTWTLGYSNSGSQGATGSVIMETVPANTTFKASASTAGWSCPDASPAGTTCTLTVGTIAAAGSGSVTFAVTLVSPAPAGLTTISNTASIADDAAHGPDPNPANNQASDTTPVDAAPDLSIAKTDGVASAAPGDTRVYGLTYMNSGTQDATGVTLTETVPATTTFVMGSSTAGWSCPDGSAAGTTCTFTIGNLAMGASATASFAVKVVSTVDAGAESLVNTASVADDGANGVDPTPANNTGKDTDTLSGTPDLALTKSDGGTFVAPGGTASYTLTVSDVGTQNAKGVVLTDIVPANSTFNAGASTPNWSCANGAPVGSVCTLALGADVVVGTPVSATFAVTIDNPVTGGVEQLSNTASVADDGSGGADPSPANNTASDTTPIEAAPDLVITKTAGAPTANAGDLITYTLSYSNAGSQAASSVLITETVPVGTTFSAAASSAGWSCADASPAGTTCSLLVGTVVVGGAGTRLFAVQVVAAIPAGLETIANTVTIADDGASGPDHDLATNQASTATTVDAAPDLHLTKTHAGVVAAGQVVVFSIAYSNQGTQAAAGVTIAEHVPAGSQLVGAQSSAAWSCPSGSVGGTACTFTIDNLAVGAGGVVKFAVLVAAPVEAGVESLTNTATIDDDHQGGADPTPADNTATDTSPLAANPDLWVSLSTSTPTVLPLGTAIWQLQYGNRGDQAAKGVVLTLVIQSNVGTTIAPAGWTCTGTTTLTCTLAIGLLPPSPGQSATFTKPFLLVLGPAVSMVATATLVDDGSGGADPTPADNTQSSTVTAAGFGLPGFLTLP